MRRIALGLLLLFPMFLFAQEEQVVENPYRPFRHLDVGATVGTTGIGIDLATHMGKYLDLRVGFTFVPPIHVGGSYSMTTNSDMKNPDGTPMSEEQKKDRIQRLCGYLGDLVQSKDVDEYIRMDQQIYSYQGKILLDIYPFRKRNWHFTVGCFIGNKRMGEAVNSRAEAPTMMGINLYNKMYDQIQELDPYEYPSISLGDYSFEMDPQQGKLVKEKFNSYGRVAVHMGDFPDGTPHYVTPNANGVLKADLYAPIAKPYVGFGYNAYLGRDKRWNVGFDAGILVLGKTPCVRTEDGVCLVHDVVNIKGDVGKYISVMSKMPVYPLVEFKTSYKIL